MQENNKENKLTVKSAGFVNGEYKIILSNDTEIDPKIISIMEFKKSSGMFGILSLELYLDNKTTLNNK